jgi:hypothetical protein
VLSTENRLPVAINIQVKRHTVDDRIDLEMHAQAIDQTGYEVLPFKQEI